MDKHLKIKNVIFNVQVIGVTGLFRESYSQVWFNKKPVTITITIITIYSHNFYTVSSRSFLKTFLHERKTTFYANWMDAWAPRANYIENNHMKMLLMIVVCISQQKNNNNNKIFI